MNFDNITIKIIDAHTHVFPDKIADKSRASVSKFYDLPMYTKGTMSELMKLRQVPVSIDGKSYIIDRQLICSPAVTPTQTASINTFIAEQVHKYDGLIGFGTLHPDNEDYEKIIDGIIFSGLSGIKLHSDFQQFNIDDKRMYPIYRYIAKKNLPILFHMGDKRLDFSSPLRLKNVLNDIPELKVIAAHTGGYERWKDAITLPETDNLYFDISSSLSIMPKELFFKFLSRFGYEHFFFGSDFPMWNPYEVLKILIDYKLDDDVFTAIISENFLRFMGINN